MDYATSRMVAGSSSDEVIYFFNLPNTFSRTIVLGLTKLLTEFNQTKLRVLSPRANYSD
jgi:hypothetical protein